MESRVGVRQDRAWTGLPESHSRSVCLGGQACSLVEMLPHRLESGPGQVEKETRKAPLPRGRGDLAFWVEGSRNIPLGSQISTSKGWIERLVI